MTNLNRHLHGAIATIQYAWKDFFGKRMRKQIGILELCWRRVFRVYTIYDISITVFVWILWSSFSIPPQKLNKTASQFRLLRLDRSWTLLVPACFGAEEEALKTSLMTKNPWKRRKKNPPFFKSLYFNKKNRNNTSIKTSLHHLQPNYLFSASSSWWFAKSQRDTRSASTAWPSEPGRSVWRTGSDPPFVCCSGGKHRGNRKI